VTAGVVALGTAAVTTAANFETAMLHSVGCAQPSASVFIKNWNKASYTSACVHAFIDGSDGTVYQTLPWNRRGWHCGKGTSGSSANDTHIGVEMCEPGSITYTSGANFTVSDAADAKAVAKRTYEAAIELFAYLCQKYSLDPTADGVIISHAEGYSRGVASNPADPAHLWKGLGLSYTIFFPPQRHRRYRTAAHTEHICCGHQKYKNRIRQTDSRDLKRISGLPNEKGVCHIIDYGNQAADYTWHSHFRDRTGNLHSSH